MAVPSCLRLHTSPHATFTFPSSSLLLVDTGAVPRSCLLGTVLSMGAESPQMLSSVTPWMAPVLGLLDPVLALIFHGSSSHMAVVIHVPTSGVRPPFPHILTSTPLWPRFCSPEGVEKSGTRVQTG